VRLHRARLRLREQVFPTEASAVAISDAERTASNPEVQRDAV
jgi:hypothetical protein